MSKKIRHVQNEDALSSDLISQPTKELERRLKLLENSIEHLASKGTVSNVVIKDKPCKSDVQVYNAVYYNPASGLYEKASAKVEFRDSTFETLPSSMVTGIVVKKVGNTVDILVDGTWPVAVMESSGNLLETGEVLRPGRPYYLSKVESGRLTSRPPSLAIQVAVMSDSDLLMNKVYGSPEGLETSSKYEMGMRPAGGLITMGNRKRIVGFHALESNAAGTAWELTSAGTKYDQSGYMVAEGEAMELIDEDLFAEIRVLNTSGNIRVVVASTLAGLSDGTEISSEDYSSIVENDDEPFKVSTANHEALRTLKLNNSAGRHAYTIKFKFVVNEGQTFDLDFDRTTIFKVPDSFRGWKELDTSDIEPGSADHKHQITPYYSSVVDCDYPDYEHQPAQGSLYYSTKSDFGFVSNWPPEPLGKTILMMNGVELMSSTMIETGNSSLLHDNRASLALSPKTLYWVTQFASTQPWDNAYSQYTKADAAHNSEAKLTHLPTGSGDVWYWTELMYSFEPYMNRGWVYSNKLNVYSKSSKVMGVGVLPPLKIQDRLTGLEPTYDGEPMTGNLVIWSSEKDNIVSRTNEVPLGRLNITSLYTNTTKFNVAVKELLFIVTEQNGAQLSNEALGKEFLLTDSARVNVGTGLEGSLSENIVKERHTNVYEYDTYAVMTIDEGAAVIPPGGVLRMRVYSSFPVGQTVSIIMSGRIV